MVQRKSAKFQDFTEVLDALDAIDAFPFGRNLSADDQLAPEPHLQTAPDRRQSSRSWLLNLLISVSWHKTPQAAPMEYAEPEVSFSVEDATAILAEMSLHEQEAIEAELGLLGDVDLLDLQQIRRNFAKENHPDRVAPEQRSAATRRMTIANMLLDEAIRRRRH